MKNPNPPENHRQLLGTALSLLPLLAAPAPALAQATPADLPKSKAEMTNYEETSRYEDVMTFFGELQKKSPLIRVESFGKTVEGRDMPLVILSDPPVSQPREARALGKPIVFFMANIHAGEVEGKEAVQHFSRRVLLGDLKSLLEKLVIVIAPDYNADGNEKINLTNRTAQYGPINGVGVRENSQGFDLNRDYIKLDAPETRALVRLFNDWDPIMTVDLHTTNGSYHGYHLTYSIPLNPMTDTPIYTYHRDKMMPAIADAMLASHKWRTYYYGNFSQESNPRSSAFGPATAASRPASSMPGPPISRGTPAASTEPAATSAGRRGGRGGGGGGGNPANPTAWYAFIHSPRVGQNYVGLRNRFTILSEAYSYISFKDRIDCTADFVLEICRYTIAHADEMTRMADAADQAAIARGLSGQPFQLGISYEQTPLKNPVDIIVGDAINVMNPKNNRNMRAMDESKNHVVKMPDYATFAATQFVATPRAYLFRDDASSKAVVEKLLNHGISVEALAAPLTVDVDAFPISKITKVTTPFQSHHEVKVDGAFKKESVTFPAGTLVVRTAQPLGTLACYLLEPQSDDSLTTWNFFDPSIEEGKEHPVYKLNAPFLGSTRRVTEVRSPETRP